MSTKAESIRWKPFQGARRFVVLVLFLAASAAGMALARPLANLEGANIFRIEVAGSTAAAAELLRGVAHEEVHAVLWGDLLLILCYASALIFGCLFFGRAYRVRRFRGARKLMAALAGVAAILDLIENAAIALGLYTNHDLAWWIAACSAWAKFVVLAVVAMYVVIAAFTYVFTPDWLRKAMEQPPELTESAARVPLKFGIAASGGGIRSASLVLGSLQALDEAYPKANSLGPSWTTVDKATSVSGGSYIAGGYAVARSARRPAPESSDQQPPEKLPYATQPPCREAWRIDRSDSAGSAAAAAVVPGPEERHLLGRLGYLLAPNPSGLPRPAKADGATKADTATKESDAALESRDVPGLIALVVSGAVLNMAVLVGLLWLVLQPYGWLLHSELLECVPGSWWQCLTKPTLVLPVAWWGTAAVACLLVWVGAGWVRAAFRPGSWQHSAVVALNRHGRGVVMGLIALTVVLAILLLLMPTLVAVLPKSVDDSIRSLTPAAVVAALGSVAALVRGLRGKAVRFAPYVGGALFVAALLLISVQFLATVSLEDSIVPSWSPIGAGTVLTPLMRWMGWLAVAGLGYLIVSAEWWSMAGFYRARLRMAFATYRTGRSGQVDGCGCGATDASETMARAYLNGSHPRRDAEPSVYELLPRNDASRNGSPLLVCTTAHASGPEVKTHYGIPAVSVTIDPDNLRMNLPSRDADAASTQQVSATTQQIEQLLYRRGGARLTTMLTVGISGAAISPAMGRYRIGPTRGLLAAANVRLGVWMPNPRYAAKVEVLETKADEGLRPNRPNRKVAYPRPRLSYLLKEMFGIHDLDDPYVYLTDGGHWENTGLVELLRGNDFKEVVCLDADEKPRQTVSQIAQAINLAALECGVTIRLSLDPLRGAADAGRGGDYSPQSVALGVIQRGDHTGLLWYAKPVLTAETPCELLSYAECDPDYPATSTIDQFFHTAQFTAYRDLGRFNARQIVIARYRLAMALHTGGFEQFQELAGQAGAHWWLFPDEGVAHVARRAGASVAG